MKVILEWGGNAPKQDEQVLFERAITTNDDSFDLIDSIIWELDYGTGESKHVTEHGEITIRVER